MSKYLDLQIASNAVDGVDASSVRVLDTGDSDPDQKCTFVSFYATAAAAMVEAFLAAHSNNTTQTPLNSLANTSTEDAAVPAAPTFNGAASPTS